MNIKNKCNGIARRFRSFARSTTAQLAAGTTALVAAPFAMAADGDLAGSVVTQITSGKSDVSGILMVLAGVLGLFLLWSMIKRAK